MKLVDIKINTFGGSPVAEHNYPCPVYYDEEKAVLYSGPAGWFFTPSWRAQREGYQTVRAQSWFQRLLLRWFFDG